MMTEQKNLAIRQQEEDALKADFLGFFRSRIFNLLPPECRDAREDPRVISCVDGAQTKFNINYILREGEPERRSEKPNIPERKIVEQSLRLYAQSKGDLLKRLHVIIETRRYFFQYP